MASQLMLAPPAPQQAQSELTNAQSLALVKIFLNSSLACICHTRELINWQADCFRKRYIDHIALEDDNVYDNFRDHEPATPGSSQEIRVLVQGSSSPANRILDMIEHGVFDAIESSYLETLQIFVTTDMAEAKAIRETYTYRFEYYDNVVASVELKEQQQHLSLSDAQRSFKAAIRCLLRAVKDLPRLTGKRSIGMSIAYNDNCPDDYVPSGFIDAANHKVVPEDWERLWDGSGQIVSKFDSTHHAVSIAARNATFGYQTASQIQDTVISKELQLLQKTSSGRDPGLVSTLPAPAASPNRSAIPTRELSEQPVTSMPRTATTRSAKAPKSGTRSSTRSKSQKSRPKSIELGDGDKNPLVGLAILAKRRRRRDINPEKLAEVIVQAHCLDFSAHEGTTVFDPDQLEQGILCRSNDPSDTVRCECGSQNTCEAMVFCQLCNSCQHSECYGLTLISRASSMPSQHLCYSCLLLPKEEGVLKHMVGLVHMRLALVHISGMEERRLDLVEELPVKVFGTSASAADGGQKARLIQRLVDEAVISKPQGRYARVLALTPVQKQKLQTEYLDPLAAISHLYRTVKDGDSDESKAAELESELKQYSGGQDYRAGHGVEDVLVVDSLGEPVVRWGYFTAAPKRKATTEPSDSDEPSPRRRRISISREFIDLDRSDRASSASYEDPEARRAGRGATGRDFESMSLTSLSTDTDIWA